MNIVPLINQIANISGTNDKIAYLSSISLVEGVKTALYFAYSPKFVYGIKKIPVVGAGECELNGTTFHSIVVPTMRALHNRDVTGKAATAAVVALLSKFEEDAQTLIRGIIARDLRINMGTTVINKAVPDLIEPEPPYMRCSLMKEGNFENFGERFISQLKSDGLFLNTSFGKRIESNIITRNGKEIAIGMLGTFNKEVDSLNCFDDHGNVMMGEGVLVDLATGEILTRKESNGIMNSVLKGGERFDSSKYFFKYYVWDIIPIEYFVQKGEYKVRYEDRLKKLENLITRAGCKHIEVCEYEIVSSYDEALVHYEKIRKRKLEGTIIKNLDSFWKDGTSKDQIKMKAEVDIDLLIMALNPGNGQHEKTFGSIEMWSSCGMLRTNIPGFSHKLRQYIFDNFEEEFKGKVASITGNELITSKKSKYSNIFLPRWKELRLDKNVADDLPRIKEIFESVL